MNLLSHATTAKRTFLVRTTLPSLFGSALGLGLLIGFLATVIEIERGTGFSALVAGPWTGWPRSEVTEIDPYSRAILAYSGKRSLSESDAMSFVAQTDSTGTGLDSACDYVLTGAIPAARYWTLILSTPAGALIANPAERQGFTSSEVLRNSEGQFEIHLSRQARPGNWLPLGGSGKFILILRFYDSDLISPTAVLDAAHMPAILRGHCE